MLGGYRRAVVVVACVGRLDPRVRLFRQRGDHVRKHVVRQPASAVVVGLARPHPVTRSAWVACNAVCALARVIPRRQESASRADRKVRLPLRTGTAVGVQHERRAEGHTTICGANVENVAGITASAVLSIDQVNEIVDSSRLSPALVPPVGTKIGKHAGKVTGSRYTRSGEGCASIGVTPRATAIGGFEDEIRVVGREGLVAAKTLTAARGIEPDRNPIAGWLVVQNNGIAKGVVEGALTIGLGEPGKSGAAIGGDRGAGDVDRSEVAAP